MPGSAPLERVVGNSVAPPARRICSHTAGNTGRSSSPDTPARLARLWVSAGPSRTPKIVSSYTAGAVAALCAATPAGWETAKTAWQSHSSGCHAGESPPIRASRVGEGAKACETNAIRASRGRLFTGRMTCASSEAVNTAFRRASLLSDSEPHRVTWRKNEQLITAYCPCLNGLPGIADTL